MCLVLLREIAEAVRPPRAMLVPFPHGYALGKPDDPDGQRRVVEAALKLFEEPGPGPVLQSLVLSP